MTKTTSPVGKHLIQGYETKQYVGYIPLKGDKVTAGWGHTGPDVHLGMRYTDDQIERWFDSDLRAAEAEANTVPCLDQLEFDALVSLVFNIGVHNLEVSTLLKDLKALNFQGALAEWLKWDHAQGKELPGLLRRRLDEAALFKKGMETAS